MGEWSWNEVGQPSSSPITHCPLIERMKFFHWRAGCSFHFIPLHSTKEKKNKFIFSLLSFRFTCGMKWKELKDYYNSKLIEQLADNIKTKFIWFLWRKQVVKLSGWPFNSLLFFNFLFENGKVDWKEERVDGLGRSSQRQRNQHFIQSIKEK